MCSSPDGDDIIQGHTENGEFLHTQIVVTQNSHIHVIMSLRSKYRKVTCTSEELTVKN